MHTNKPNWCNKNLQTKQKSVKLLHAVLQFLKMKRFKVTVMHRRFEDAYIECIKSFFGFKHWYSVTKMFCDLGLPTFHTVAYNAQVRHS